MREQSDRKEEFTEQLRQSHRQLLGYIFTLLRNLEDAQDVFQQTCIVLWDHFDEFEPGTNFTAWACTVAQFKVRDFLKCRRRYEAHLSEVFVERLAAIQSQVTSNEIEARHEALGVCIEKLTPHQRSLIEHCYGGSEKIPEVAEQLGRSVRGLYNSLQRIREGLCDCVQRTLAKERRP